MKLVARHKEEQNEAAFDPWTVVHFAAGLALGLMDVPARSAMTAAVAYEMVEQIFERSEPGLRFFHTHGPERLPNALVDLGVFAAGHALGDAWNRTGDRRDGRGP